MKVNHMKTAVVGSLLVLAGLAVILLPAYAGDLEPGGRPVPKLQGVYKMESIARPEPKLQGVYKFEPVRDDLTAKARLEEGCGAAEAIGYSETFSFDEAFENALDALPPDPTAVYPDKMVIVKVVDIGARFGGIMGVSHMYVRVRREADPACLSDREEQKAEPRAGRIHKLQGEAEKLPDREVKVGEITKPKPIE